MSVRHSAGAMRFRHSDRIWSDFPELVAVALRVDDVSANERTANEGTRRERATKQHDIEPLLRRFESRARDRLQGIAESELPEIQAWRRAFGRMGLKPTQYRCASEALLRRFRKEDRLPRIHPLVDLCNAVSLAYAVPIAVLDLSKVSGDIEVRYANGTESYTTFGGEQERPAPGEVVFADDAEVVHARRWTNRQSGLSAVGVETREALIVAEALHESAPEDVRQLGDELAAALSDPSEPSIAAVTAGPTILTAAAPWFEA